MKDECVICGAPLKYLENGEAMECAVCQARMAAVQFYDGGSVGGDRFMGRSALL